MPASIGQKKMSVFLGGKKKLPDGKAAIAGELTGL